DLSFQLRTASVTGLPVAICFRRTETMTSSPFLISALTGRTRSRLRPQITAALKPRATVANSSGHSAQNASGMIRFAAVSAISVAFATGRKGVERLQLSGRELGGSGFPFPGQ